MNTPTFERCPYTLSSLQDLPETDVEHIFPMAIGGGRDYSVKVSKKHNSNLGRDVDAPLLNTFFVAANRFRFGNKSHSGESSWSIAGQFRNSGRPVEIKLLQDGEMEIHMPKSVEMSNDGKSGTIKVSGTERDEFLREFIENHGKKERVVQITKESASQETEILFGANLDEMTMKRGLTKIAFLAVYSCLGDAFLKDSLISEWHNGFLEGDANSCKLPGMALIPGQVAPLFPNLREHEHATAVVKIDSQPLSVFVALFGGRVLNSVSQAVSSDFDLASGEGCVAICDALSRKTTRMSWEEYLVESGQ